MTSTYLRTALTFRLASADDARDIARIHVRSWQAAYRTIFSPEFLAGLSQQKHEAFWAHTIARRTPRVMLAVRDDVTLGWLAWGPSRDRDRTAQVAEIEALYIDPSHWRKGAGSMLIDEAVEAAASERYRSITLWALQDNTPSLNFYRAKGFVQDGAYQTERVGGRDADQLRFRMRID
jgi:L-amino acid N-acyltransferase YncA